MLTVAAVFILAGDHDLFQRLNPEDTAALHNIIMDAETVKKFRQKERIGNQQSIAAGILHLSDQGIGAYDDIISGFRLPWVTGPALRDRFAHPFFNRE